MKNKKVLFPLAVSLCQRMNLLAFFLTASFLVACDDGPKTLRERLIAHKWENVEVSLFIPMFDVYTGIYDFSGDGTYSQTFNDSIVSGKWEMQGDSIVVFNKDDADKKRFWKNIEMSEDYLRVSFTNNISPNPNLDAYDINGTSTIYQNEVYIPVE